MTETGARRSRTSAEDRLRAVIDLHSQHSGVGLADGKWYPLDGDEHPCLTLQVATGEGQR